MGRGPGTRCNSQKGVIGRNFFRNSFDGFQPGGRLSAMRKNQTFPPREPLENRRGILTKFQHRHRFHEFIINLKLMLKQACRAKLFGGRRCLLAFGHPSGCASHRLSPVGRFLGRARETLPNPHPHGNGVPWLHGFSWHLSLSKCMARSRLGCGKIFLHRPGLVHPKKIPHPAGSRLRQTNLAERAAVALRFQNGRRDFA